MKLLIESEYYILSNSSSKLCIFSCCKNNEKAVLCLSHKIKSNKMFKEWDPRLWNFFWKALIDYYSCMYVEKDSQSLVDVIQWPKIEIYEK